MGYRTGSQQLVWAISEPVTRSRGLGPAKGSAQGSPAPLVQSHPFPAASGRRRRTESFSSGEPPARPGREACGRRWSRSHGSSRGHEAQERAPRPGVQPRAAWRGQPVVNAEGRRARPEGSAGGHRPRQVRGPPDSPAAAQARAPPGGHRPAVSLHGRAGSVHAPLTGKRPNRSAQEPAQRPGAAAPRGTWPGEGSPVRDRACAVARARPSAGKEHAQCEGTSGYVGAQGMLAESRDPAHAQKRPEPATHWWREKREKSPQSYVRKGRVLRGGCGLPRGPAVLLGRGA